MALICALVENQIIHVIDLIETLRRSFSGRLVISHDTCSVHAVVHSSKLVTTSPIKDSTNVSEEMLPAMTKTVILWGVEVMALRVSERRASLRSVIAIRIHLAEAKAFAISAPVLVAQSVSFDGLDFGIE